MKLTDELWQHIQENCLTGGHLEALDRDVNLIDNGVLDSLSTLNLVSCLEKEYGIRIKSEDMTPENFGTVAQLAAMVEKKKTGL